MPHKYRWGLLLLASCLFYMCFIPAYILILLVTIVIDFAAGIWIFESRGRRRKGFLILSIVSTCLVLFVFKYFNFFNANFSRIATFFHWNYPIAALNVILPIGLSFHTFQSLSYVIEVYRGKQVPERHFGIYALYVMFYPQLVAGPIERPQNLLHQFKEEHAFDYQRVTDGLKLMAWGLCKKVVIADRLALLVNRVYDAPTDFAGFPLLLATVFFAFQIYCDFSGYSDIAIGAARVMGFTLMENFNRPYFSKSIAEFWKRWHISLSTWFRDYLYIPLGGNRVSFWRWQLNLFLTFVVSGLWHGANWTFVVWGALNGFYLVFAIWTQRLREDIAAWLGVEKYPRLFKAWQTVSTFALICLAWVFFRARSLSDAVYIVTHLFTVAGPRHESAAQPVALSGLGLSAEELSIAVVSIVLLEGVHLLQGNRGLLSLVTGRPVYVRWAVYLVLVAAITYLGVFGKNDFIYFQF